MLQSCDNGRYCDVERITPIYSKFTVGQYDSNRKSLPASFHFGTDIKYKKKVEDKNSCTHRPFNISIWMCNLNPEEYFESRDKNAFIRDIVRVSDFGYKDPYVKPSKEGIKTEDLPCSVYFNLPVEFFDDVRINYNQGCIYLIASFYGFSGFTQYIKITYSYFSEDFRVWIYDLEEYDPTVI